MALTIACDKCGKTFKHESYAMTTYAYWIYDRSKDTYIQHDLCPDCMKALGDWLENKNTETCSEIEEN